ncbi:MAG: GNAT family N-acetyltransferase [Tepidiformaceae bacterium]
MEPEGTRRHRRSSAAMITSESFASLREEWASLHSETRQATPFAHPAWHEVWLRQFGSKAAPVFLSVRVEEKLVGVVPLAMERDGARILGHAEICDYAGLLVADGAEAAVARGALEWLTEDLSSRLEAWGVRADQPLAAAFREAADPMGWQFSETPEAVSPQLALPSDFERYLSGLSKHTRHELRRKLRNLSAAGTVTFEGATDGRAVASEMDRFLHLMRASHPDKVAFLTPQMEAFLRDLAATFADLGLLRLSSLKLDGVNIAMTLAFESADTTFLYNSGYDPAYGHLAAGLIAKVFALRDSIERGMAVFDFLRGDESYKRDLGGLPVGLVTLTLRQR